MAACNNFAHEVEEFEDCNEETDNNNKTKFNLCKKNPGHEKFKSVCDLKMEDVPLEFQTDEWMEDIRDSCKRAVKLQTKFISNGREGLTWYGGVPYPYSDQKYKGNTTMVRNGTGNIFHIEMFEDEPCRCKECKNSTHPVVGHMEVSLRTARHVVFDESECVHTTVEVFYDTPDKNGVVLLEGCHSWLERFYGPKDEWIQVYCFTHDTDVMDKLKNTIGFDFPGDSDIDETEFNRSKFKSGYCVSHPHGLHKQISFGQTLFYIFSFRKDHPELPGFVRCRLKLPRIKHNLPPDTSNMENVTSPSMVEPGVEYLLPDTSKMENGTSPSMVEPGVEYLLPDTSKMENGTSPSMVEPGVEYLLPDTSKICFPCDLRGDIILARWLLEVKWRDIPEGWRYTESNGKFVPFPPGMEILCELERQHTVTYDIPTCPGSSGASVYHCDCGFYSVSGHSGVDEDWGNHGVHGI